MTYKIACVILLVTVACHGYSGGFGVGTHRRLRPDGSHSGLRLYGIYGGFRPDDGELGPGSNYGGFRPGYGQLGPGGIHGRFRPDDGELGPGGNHGGFRPDVGKLGPGDNHGGFRTDDGKLRPGSNYGGFRPEDGSLRPSASHSRFRRSYGQSVIIPDYADIGAHGSYGEYGLGDYDGNFAPNGQPRKV